MRFLKALSVPVCLNVADVLIQDLNVCFGVVTHSRLRNRFIAFNRDGWANVTNGLVVALHVIEP